MKAIKYLVAGLLPYTASLNCGSFLVNILKIIP